VPQCALAIEATLRDAGFTDGEFQTLLIASDHVKRLLEDERVKAATLTGSEPAGASVASTRGGEDQEERAGAGAAAIRSSSCRRRRRGSGEGRRASARRQQRTGRAIAAKRFIVHDNIADEFVMKVVRGMEALRSVIRFDESTEVGPLAMPQIADDIERQVNQSIAKGRSC